ncbi:MAG: packaged DNA stabilization protein [Candidatus Margulisiibacteriota bacterium]
MRIDVPLTGVFGKGRSLKANSGEKINCYIEQASTGQNIIVGTPGSTLRFTLPNSPVRGCFSDTTDSYWVAGNSVYKVDSAFNITHLGDINTYNGFVQFASSGIDLMFVDFQDGWAIKLATGVLTQITAGSFPSVPSSVAFTKGYFVVTQVTSQTFYISQELDIATTWNALDFATAEGNPDNTAGVIVYQDELVFPGYRSVEVWYFNGNPDFPFQRNSNVVIDHGCTAPRSISRLADSVYWLGGDNLGKGIVWRLNGYAPERISTHEIEQQIAKLSYINDAIGMAYMQEGHIFYILQFPSANLTLCFDAITGTWHRRSYCDPTTGDFNFWKASCICFNGNANLIGDIQSGNVYSLDLDTHTDNGDPIVRQYTTTINSSAQQKIQYGMFGINLEPGVGIVDTPAPKIGLQFSNNGHTWSNIRYNSFGAIGDYDQTVNFYRLGMARNRAFRLTTSDPVKFVLLGFVMDFDLGDS